MKYCNLMTAGRDEDGDPMEALKPRHTYNPVLQRLYQCIQTRALVPGAPLPPLDPIIEKYDCRMKTCCSFFPVQDLFCFLSTELLVSFRALVSVLSVS